MSTDTKIDNHYPIHNNCLIYSSFDDIQYMKITDLYVINIPPYLRKWIISLLEMINAVDMQTEIHAFSWMVLIYPSLLLIKTSSSDQKLVKLTNKTITTLRKFMCNEAQLFQLSLNDLLVCIELYGQSLPSSIPKYVWQQLNHILESATTLNKYLQITCTHKKHIKLVKDLLNYKITTKNTQHLKLRTAWILLITPYTQICRLNRLLKMDKYSTYLTVRSKKNVTQLCTIFNEQYNTVLKQFTSVLKEKTDSIQKYYSYYRYKTMAMCTHTNTTIPPTLSGYIGHCSVDDTFDIDTIQCLVKALDDDVSLFKDTVQDIIFVLKHKNISINIANVNKEISKTKMNKLRILDHISFHSICLHLMFQSISQRQKAVHKTIKILYKKVIKIRQQMKLILHELASHSLLFPARITSYDDILQMEFLTDTNESQCWMTHLMSGVLLNFWSTNL